MLRVDFMFADSTTDFILVIYNDYSLLIGVMTITLRNFTTSSCNLRKTRSRHAGPSKTKKEDSPIGGLLQINGLDQ